MPAIPLTETSVICDRTALKYYRTPPRYLGLCPALPTNDRRTPCREIARTPLVTEILGLPIHVLTDSRQNRSQSDTLKYHVMNHDLPFGSAVRTPHGFMLASPALTLFTLSRSMTFNQLVMTMYEMCGRFALFSPSKHLEDELAAHDIDCSNDGWTCVRDQMGRPTNLWKRQPLVTVAELKSFAHALGNIRGAKLFARAIDCISGVTASPFEAQVSMLLWINPSLGGWGYRNFGNNVPIRYSEDARALTSCDYAEVDLQILSPDGTREWILECQGRIVHDRIGAGTKDALRATALQTMGRNVTLITSDQISVERKFKALLDLLSDRLGIMWPKKSTMQIFAENELRAEIFSDWHKLGNEPSARELKERRQRNRARRTSGHFLKRKTASGGKNTQ